MKTFILIIGLFSIVQASYQELLFNGNCVTCHRTDNLNKSAPTIMEIQKRYKIAFPKKTDFISFMSEWVYKPNERTSIMQDAIEEYNLMPELAYDKETLKEVSEYIYEKEFKNNHTQ